MDFPAKRKKENRKWITSNYFPTGNQKRIHVRHDRSTHGKIKI